MNLLNQLVSTKPWNRKNHGTPTPRPMYLWLLQKNDSGYFKNKTLTAEFLLWTLFLVGLDKPKNGLSS